ncbi:hypothetical protein [Streptomyces sp. NPDC056647]
METTQPCHVGEDAEGKILVVPVAYGFDNTLDLRPHQDSPVS